MRKANPFAKLAEKARQEAQQDPSAAAPAELQKPYEDMSGAELDEAERLARVQLLKLREEEADERMRRLAMSRAGLDPAETTMAGPSSPTKPLQPVFDKGKRPRWR